MNHFAKLPLLDRVQLMRMCLSNAYTCFKSRDSKSFVEFEHVDMGQAEQFPESFAGDELAVHLIRRFSPYSP
jgi:hypothetical protein